MSEMKTWVNFQSGISVNLLSNNGAQENRKENPLELTFQNLRGLNIKQLETLGYSLP